MHTACFWHFCHTIQLGTYNPETTYFSYFLSNDRLITQKITQLYGMYLCTCCTSKIKCKKREEKRRENRKYPILLIWLQTFSHCKKERAKRKLPYHKMYPNVSKMYLNLIVQKRQILKHCVKLISKNAGKKHLSFWKNFLAAPNARGQASNNKNLISFFNQYVRF